MAFTESLTVRILGDSSGLQRELSQVLQGIEELHRRVESTTRSASQIGTALGRVAQAAGPLQQVNSLMTRISQQARTLSQQPVSLNVAPAMNSLQRLMQSISMVAAQLRNLSASSAMGGMPTFSPAIGTSATGAAPRRLAAGGVVSGPSGIDRISTRLTAGEYVLNQQAVQTLGQSFVDQLNRSPESLTGHTRFHAAIPSINVPQTPRPSLSFNHTPAAISARGVNVARVRDTFSAEKISHTTSNHFGGISVFVNQSSDINNIVDRIEQQQRALRNRRG